MTLHSPTHPEYSIAMESFGTGKKHYARSAGSVISALKISGK